MTREEAELLVQKFEDSLDGPSQDARKALVDALTRVREDAHHGRGVVAVHVGWRFSAAEEPRVVCDVRGTGRCACGAARRWKVSIEKRWRLRLVCCGRDDGAEYFETWEAAESFRQSYCSGPGTEPGGHERAGIIDEVGPALDGGGK